MLVSGRVLKFHIPHLGISRDMISNMVALNSFTPCRPKEYDSLNEKHMTPSTTDFEALNGKNEHAVYPPPRMQSSPPGCHYIFSRESINLHLWLASSVGGRSKVYQCINHTICSIITSPGHWLVKEIFRLNMAEPIPKAAERLLNPACTVNLYSPWENWCVIHPRRINIEAENEWKWWFGRSLYFPWVYSQVPC